MLAKHTHSKVSARLRCPCLVCLGAGEDSHGRKCAGCDGEETFYVDVTEDTIEDVRAWDDGPAWDHVATLLEARGLKPSDDVLKYAIADEDFESEKDERGNPVRMDDERTSKLGPVVGRYVITLKVVPYPVSRETAAAMNALVRK